MSEIIIFCEGVIGGLDVRLFEEARSKLENGRADNYVFRPVGSKKSVAAMVSQGALGLCDRDYLPSSIFNRYRADPSNHPFPLSRHCIESYLLDPNLLTFCEWSEEEAETVLNEEAGHLLWWSVSCGVVARYNHQHQRHLAIPKFVDLSREEASVAVADKLTKLKAEVARHTGDFNIKDALNALYQDFIDDGPIWTRVDGKKLLARISTRMNPAPTGGLAAWVVKQVVQGRAEVPTALMTDVQELLSKANP